MRRHEERRGKAKHFALQAAIDASDVIGAWDWDIPNDRVFAEAIVALLYNVDPDLAENGAPLAGFTASIHVDDRERISGLIGKCARDGSSYVAEYRVCSADGIMRWVLARGRFERDATGRPRRGRGIVIDISQSRVSETADVSDQPSALAHPLERAAEHCLAAREAIHELPPSLLHRLADVLLLEIGRGLATLEVKQRRKRMN